MKSILVDAFYGDMVDVCNFDAIEMSHEHELSKYERNGNRVVWAD
ncbi:MAG: hypothetical protein CM1200mP3_04160 [Chloroflexota bacterium]|nr:MAG: hypothetical protein CM1200mP3_04160 [Chloroflexota bacterium]